MRKTLFIIILILNAFTLSAQSVLYKKAILNSNLIFISEVPGQSNYTKGYGAFVDKIAVSEDGSFFTAVDRFNGIKVNETNTGLLISSYNLPDNIPAREGAFTLDVMISSNRYVFVLYNGGYGWMIDLVTRRESTFVTPVSGNNKWDYMWMAFVIPGDSVLMVNQTQKVSWHVSLKTMNGKFSQWHYNVHDVQKDLFLCGKMKNNISQDNDQMELRQYPSGKLLRTFPGAYITSKISPDGSKILIIRNLGFSVINATTGDTIMTRRGFRYVDPGSMWFDNNIFAYDSFDAVTLSNIDLYNATTRELIGKIGISEVGGSTFTGNVDYFISYGGVTRAPSCILKSTLSVFNLHVLLKEPNFFLDVINFEKAKWLESRRPAGFYEKIYLAENPVTDVDGNSYKTIIIAGQTYMAENLKTSHYNNGDLIPIITGNSEWVKTGSGARCFNENDKKNFDTYGAIYNGYAVVDKRNICPVGWHIPSNAEWETLFEVLGGPDHAGARMNSTGTVMEGTGLWWGYNFGATNNSGFTGLPGGGRGLEGKFDSPGQYAFFWSRGLYFFQLGSSDLDLGSVAAWFGFSVRCMKN